MASYREDKVKKVEEIKDRFSRSVAAILTDYRGLNVTDITKLRRKLLEENIEYKVVKNTLTRIALEDTDYNLDEYLKGPTAIAFSDEDPVAPAKIIADFAKANKDLEVKGGVVEGKVVSSEVIDKLAKLPTREELLAKAVGSIQSPLQGIVGVLNAPMRDFVGVLHAIQEKKEKAS